MDNENEIEAGQAPDQVAEQPQDQIEAPDSPQSDEVEAPRWEPEAEEEARMFGWKPPEEWKGEQPPNFAKTPDEYLDRIKSSRVFKTLQQQQEEKLRKMEAAMDAAQRRQLEQERAAYERRIAEIEAAQRKAVEEADTERYDQLAEARRQMKPPEAPELKHEQAQQRLQELAQEKPWLNDPFLRQQGYLAIEAAAQAGEPVKAMSPDEQVAYAEAKLAEYFPHKFKPEEPVHQPQAKVAGNGLAGVAPKSAFDKLPSEAKQAFERQVSKGWLKNTKADREFFAKEFNNG